MHQKELNFWCIFFCYISLIYRLVDCCRIFRLYFCRFHS
nr:MAG TPA: hypothetical protein [Caudoviricetes sp.]